MGPKEISWVPAFPVSHLIILWAQKKYIGFQASWFGLVRYASGSGRSRSELKKRKFGWYSIVSGRNLIVCGWNLLNLERFRQYLAGLGKISMRSHRIYTRSCWICWDLIRYLFIRWRSEAIGGGGYRSG